MSLLQYKFIQLVFICAFNLSLHRCFLKQYLCPFISLNVLNFCTIGNLEFDFACKMESVRKPCPKAKAVGFIESRTVFEQCEYMKTFYNFNLSNLFCSLSVGFRNNSRNLQERKSMTFLWSINVDSYHSNLSWTSSNIDMKSMILKVLSSSISSSTAPPLL